MKSQRISSDGNGETLIVVLDDDDEAFSTLQDFARKEDVSAASLTAIGAFSRATVGWFDFASKSYKEIAVDEQCEVLSAIGDIAVGDDGNPHQRRILVRARSRPRRRAYLICARCRSSHGLDHCLLANSASTSPWQGSGAHQRTRSRPRNSPSALSNSGCVAIHT